MFGLQLLAEDSNSPKSPTVEERLSAVEKKLQSLESRLDEALGGRERKDAAAGTSDTPGPEIAVVDRLDILDRKLRIFERKRELEQEAAITKLKESPIVTADSKDGFGFKSADSNFQLRLGGLVQADSRFFTDGDPTRPTGSSTFLLRKVRPVLEGTVYKHFDFKIMPDFGNGQALLQDAYLDFAYLPSAKVRFGKMKPPVGLERLQVDAENLFIERALPTNLVPNRDVGVQVFGENLRGVFNYALGVFNGVPDSGNGDLDTNNTKDFAGRVFLHPFRTTGVEPLKGLGIGLAGTAGSQLGALPVLRTPAQTIFFNYAVGTSAAGSSHRISPQAYYYWGPFGLLAEYVQSVQDVRKGSTFGQIDNQSWQVAASYVLTGEKASFKGVIPRKQFNPTARSFGAIELTTRYTQLKVDNDAFILKFADPTNAARQASTWTAGLNWYFSRNLKFEVNYDQTQFKSGSANGNRNAEKVILSRFQIYF